MTLCTGGISDQYYSSENHQREILTCISK